MSNSNKTLDTLSIRVSILSNKAFLGKLRQIKGTNNVSIMSGGKRDITNLVLDTASLIVSNNNKSNVPTIVKVGETEYQLELIELVEEK
ncbi:MULTISPECIES: hypothetical protein [Xenorhabdus]|uniref:hypothetical protein n=1 Tax=Xenorhabdus TaxID=626 RepID=UPI000649D377|nr:MULTISPECIES: hypothetical protein [Xenorhabdus]KLU14042.1 hypothetical protein AAY47_18650 [Xenorhabdus griffiniae]KOP35151.1 hypothetical protein AFK69_00665 [Xenorhabdus sp. GDc328]